MKCNHSYANELEISNLLTICIKAAQKIGITQIAIVGGFVRDHIVFDLFHQTLPEVKDIDIVIEGSVYELAKTIQNELGENRVSILRENKSYKTVEMRIDSISIDIATSRKESYISPAKNPQISTTHIEADLQRRDFTANAIAFDLINNKFIDPCKGRDAISKRQLEFIHSQSVSEDPTRIIRAARYAARLNFNLSPKSLDQIMSTIKAWPWDWKLEDDPLQAPAGLSVRLRMELELLLEEELWEKALQNLQAWGSLLLLDKNLQADHESARRIHWALKLKINPLTALIAGTSDPQKVARRLQLPMRQQTLLSESLTLRKFLSDLNISKEHLYWSTSSWCESIEKNSWHSDAIAIAICMKAPLWKTLLRWLKRWRFIKSPISAKELIKRGWEPGPNIQKELNRLRNKQLDQLY